MIIVIGAVTFASIVACVLLIEVLFYCTLFSMYLQRDLSELEADAILLF